MITVIFKSKSSHNIDVSPEVKKGSWISITNPDEREINDTSIEHNLDGLILNDSLDPYEVPRIEEEEGVTYIFTRYPFETTTATLLIAIQKEHIFTVSKEDFTPLQNFLSSKIDFCTTQKTKLVIQIFSEINLSYQKRLYEINRSIRQLSAKIENIQNADIIKFVNYERNLNDYLSSLIPMQSTLEQLLSGKYIQLYEEDHDLVEDLSINTNQLIETCKSYMKNIVNIRSAYSTILSNNLNKIMKILTSLTVILTIPTIIASFFGMNITLPLQNHPLAFAFVGISTIGICFTLLYFFIKKDLF